MRRNYGGFEIKEDLVRSHPEIVAAAFAEMQFVAFRAEMMFAKQRIVYQGFSPMFEEIERGMVIPEYRVDILIEIVEDGEPGYGSVKVEHVKPLYPKESIPDDGSGD